MISGMINLSSFKIQTIAKQLHIDISNLESGGLFQYLNGVALVAILVLLLIIVIILLTLLCRNKIVQGYVTKIKQILFMNFLIRYFQASFINFNFSSQKSLQNSKTGDQEVAPSVFILIFQYIMVIWIICFLTRKRLEEL